MFLISLFVTTPASFCWYGEYTITEITNYPYGVMASRCDHYSPTHPDTDDAWTGLGLVGYTYQEMPCCEYVSIPYAYFRRAYGGGASQYYPYPWTTDGNMQCYLYVDTGSQYYGISGTPVWQNYGSPQWPAYYHDYQTSVVPIPWYLPGETIGSFVGSWFENTSDPDDRMYISSFIDPDDMWSTGPNYRES